MSIQLCVWSIDGWEKRKSRFIQPPPGRASPFVGDTKVQFHNDLCTILFIRYHVPRSFLKEGEPNTLILFEEAGGEPFNVNFQTVAVGTICGHVEEGKTLTLSCQGTGTISNIEFASFGNPVGMCGAFQKGTCDSQIALDAIQKACVGKMACSIEGSARVLGDSKCKNMPVSLAVQAVCS